MRCKNNFGIKNQKTLIIAIKKIRKYKEILARIMAVACKVLIKTPIFAFIRSKGGDVKSYKTQNGQMDFGSRVRDKKLCGSLECHQDQCVYNMHKKRFLPGTSLYST